MISSMTGYAAASMQHGGQQLSIDLRSVNSRYLEIHFRCGDEFRAMEAPMREQIARHVQRGKLECRVMLSNRAEADRDIQMDLTLLERLNGLSKTVTQHMPDAHQMSIAEVLHWPGMLNDPTASQDMAQPCLQLLDTVLGEFVASRQREGAKLRQHLLDRAAQMEAQVGRVAPRLPELIRTYQDRLIQRFTEVMGSADDERIRQEIALFAQKIDVDEELSRLGVHIREVRRILDAGGSAGKRLDFLMQELNREANTLGSKSVSVETTQVAMELKVLIEQMREQVQNIE